MHPFEHFINSLCAKHENVLSAYGLLLGQQEVNKVQNFLPFLKLMRRSETNFHAHSMRESQVISTFAPLVFNESFSEILWPGGWALGQVT